MKLPSPLTVEEERKIFDRIDELRKELETTSDGKEKIEEEIRKLRNLIVGKTVKFVISRTKKYLRSNGVARDDMVQEGCLSLLQAFDTYDRKKGTRFITWSKFWIDAYIRRYFSQGHMMIRVPSNVYDRWNREGKERGRQELLTGPNGRSEQKKELNIIVVPLENKKKYKGIMSPHMQRKIAENSEVRTPDEELWNIENPEFLRKLVNKQGILSPKEREILKDKWGLFGRRQKTHREIGERIGNTVSKQRIQQIEAGAIRKIKEYVKKNNIRW